jgi:tRNA nucleotidyltransferase (CCA-adding enzyme)
MNVYLAGGAVRDLLLGRAVADRDYLVTGATRKDFMNRFPHAREVGRTFPVFLLDGLEFSFPRAETIEDELRSRDLTVNAMLLDRDGELLCHPDAMGDLRARVLRPASERSFVDDPLRVFRAARFWARLPDFHPHDELIETMRAVADQGLLDALPPDRIGQETIKALQAQAPGNYLRLLARSNCLNPWFREFSQSMNIPAGPLPYHDADVLEHTCRVMDSLAGNPLAVWMALCHDIGKTATPPESLPHHHGHDLRGAAMAAELARRIRLSNAHIQAGGVPVAHDGRAVSRAAPGDQGGHAHGPAPLQTAPAALLPGSRGPGQGRPAPGRPRSQAHTEGPTSRGGTGPGAAVGPQAPRAARPGTGRTKQKITPSF